MKSLIKGLLLITLVFAVLTATSCEKDNDGMNDFYEAGLRFSLPEDMRQLSVDYANVAYGNNEGVEFLIYYYSRDELLSMLYLDKDATVEEYEDDFIRYNEYQNVEKNYDAEKNTIVAEYIYEPENTYYCDFVLRNYELLVHVTMCCDAELRDKYEPIFEEWIKYISIDS